jgi:hypothetical protein
MKGFDGIRGAHKISIIETNLDSTGTYNHHYKPYHTIFSVPELRIRLTLDPGWVKNSDPDPG